MGKWLNSYNLYDNEKEALKIMKGFNINKYHFSMVGGHTSLIIDINLNNYRIEIDEYDNKMIVKKKQFIRRGQKTQKEYMRTVFKVSDNCIYESIKWIKDNSIKYY